MSSAREVIRDSPNVIVRFNEPHRMYQPRAALILRYSIEGIDNEKVRAVERSVLWYTEGKGEEDLGVHFFERLSDRSKPTPALTAGSFSTQLPFSPLSYEGVIVKVRWCVRVRIFFEGSRDFVSEHVFEMGQIPPANTGGGRLP